jgi:Domain of unknown function (DUF6456)
MSMANGATPQRQVLMVMRALARQGAAAGWDDRAGARRVRRLLVAGGVAALTQGQAQDAISAGLIAERPQMPGTFEITLAGRAWLRRKLAGDDPFQTQHRELRAVAHEVKAGATPQRPMVVNDAESPLAWLRQRKDRNGAPILTDHQFAAGERLRQDYTFAALGPRVTANWSDMAPSDRQRRAGGSAGMLRDDVIAAKQRVALALGDVGPELGQMLMDVCCLLKGIEGAETAQGLPQRSGKVVLGLGLTALARHYGLIAPPSPARGPMHILHWGDPSYRPKVESR